MTFSHAIAALAILVLGMAPVQAAVLQGISGQVVVNRGDGFESAMENTEVLPGDQVVVAPGATAILAYGGGCSVPVPAESVVEVAPKAPCPAAPPNSNGGWQMLTQAAPGPGGAVAGGGTAAGGAAGGAAAGGAAGGGAAAGGAGLGGLGVGTVAVAAGVAGAAGITAAVIANSQNKKPASQ